MICPRREEYVDFLCQPHTEHNAWWCTELEGKYTYSHARTWQVARGRATPIKLFKFILRDREGIKEGGGGLRERIPDFFWLSWANKYIFMYTSKPGPVTGIIVGEGEREFGTRLLWAVT